MFDTAESYELKLKFVQPKKDNGKTYCWEFSDKEELYSLNIEYHYIEHHIEVCAVKFYLKKDKNNPKRYNKVQKRNSCRKLSKILNTCLNACRHTLKTYSDASFVFMGAYRFIESKEGIKYEDIRKTIRHRIYIKYVQKKLKADFLDLKYLKPYVDDDYSCVLFFNKNADLNEKEQDNIQKIKEYFKPFLR